MSTSSPESAGQPSLEHRELGVVHYDSSWDLQRQLRDAVIEGQESDVLLTLEHDPPVLTGGRRADATELLTPPEELDRQGVLLRRVERGGSWTWHGPGQLVAYPVVAIKRWGLRVPDFVEGLEGAMLELTSWALERADLDLEALGWRLGRRCGFPGAWLQRPGGAYVKIGAVGVHFRRFVSLHGLAWNLDPAPWGFDLIQPCGLSDEVTSVRRLVDELGGRVDGIPSRQEAALHLAEILPLWWGRSGGRGCQTLGDEDGRPNRGLVDVVD